MSATLEVLPDARLARPLKVLVPLIKDDLNNAREAGLEYYRAAGEKLQEAKSQVRRGEWGKWLSANFELSQRTANVYMDLAGYVEIAQATENVRDTNSQAAANRQRNDFRTLSEFSGDIRRRHDSPAWHEPIREAIDNLNVPRMRQQQQDKEVEEKIRLQLGMQLIDVGYKVLSTKLHPDKGGSDEAMVRLQAVRDHLKGELRIWLRAR